MKIYSSLSGKPFLPRSQLHLGNVYPSHFPIVTVSALGALCLNENHLRAYNSWNQVGIEEMNPRIKTKIKLARRLSYTLLPGHNQMPL